MRSAVRDDTGRFPSLLSEKALKSALRREVNVSVAGFETPMGS